MTNNKVKINKLLAFPDGRVDCTIGPGDCLNIKNGRIYNSNNPYDFTHLIVNIQNVDQHMIIEALSRFNNKIEKLKVSWN